MNETTTTGLQLDDHRSLPTCSMVFTESGLLAAKIASVGDALYGLVAYIVDDGRPHHSGTWTRFHSREWQRVLGVGHHYEPLIRERESSVLVPGLGLLARIEPATITTTLSTRDPGLLAEHAQVLDRLARWLDVAPAALGVSGSAMYKTPERRNDLDVVIYGEDAARRAHARIKTRTPPRSFQEHHLHFQVPEIPLTLDPRFIAAETFTHDLVTGRFDHIGTEPIRRLRVVDSRDGTFYPSRYVLSDGTVLLSYRLGHSALFYVGDVISGPDLPVLARDGVRYRVVLRYESLTCEGE